MGLFSGAGVLFRSAFFFKNFKKKKKKKKKKKIFFKIVLKKKLPFPKGMLTIFWRFLLWWKPPMHFGLGFVFGVFLRKFGNSRYEKKISAGGRNFGRRPKSLPKAGILAHLPKKIHTVWRS